MSATRGSGGSRWGGVIGCAVLGALALGVGIQRGAVLRTRLTTWPEVEGHVDSATVIPWSFATREASYATRVWLTYTQAGVRRHRKVDGSYSGDWAAEARAADAVVRRGSVSLLLDPADPSDVTLDPGYTLRFFAWPAAIAAGGLALLLGALVAAIGRRRRIDGRAAAQRRGWSGGWALGALGVACLAIAGAIGAHEVGRRIRWVAVPARVDSADMVQRQGHQHGWRYAPRLWIAYERGGRVYRRPVLTGAPWSGTPITAQLAGDAAARSGRTTAWVDPGDPYEASLDPTAAGNLVIPGGLAAAGLAALAAAIRLRRRRREPAA